MADESQEISVLELAKKLTAVEKKLVELEVRLRGTPLTEATLRKQNEAIEKGRKWELTPQTQVEEKGPDPRIKVVVSRRNPETGEPIEEDGKLKSSDDSSDKDRAFVLRKNVYPARFSYYVDDSSEIDVLNRGLWGLLREHLGDYPYHTFRESPVTLNSPYEAIIFNFDKLERVEKETPKDEDDKLAREDLGRLLRAISRGSSGDSNLDKYFKLRPTYRSSATVTFQDLWTVFPPGTLIYGRPFQNEHQVFVVKDNVLTWPLKDQQRSGGRDYLPWKLEAWSYDWRDGTFRRIDYTLLFEHFEGHLPLTMLPYYPFHLHQDYEKVKEELVDRGKRFRRYCQAKEGERLFEYQGNAVSEKTGLSNLRQDEEDGTGDVRSPGSFSTSEQAFFLGAARRTNTGSLIPTVKSSQVQSRVMVDYDSYFQYGQADGRIGALEPGNSGPGCGCSDCQANEGLMRNYRTRFDSQRSVRATEWEEEQYLICPPRVLGYILQEKEWAQLQVSSLSEISNDSTQASILDQRLKLADDASPSSQSRLRNKNKRDTSTKALLLDLVRSHTSTLDESGEGQGDDLEIDDIIPGKGKGLVILLYGPPGVGKTSTAETIAIATKKPLFSISVADVGTQAKHVESNLSRIFSLATRWQAILLLDEADVFLESRGRGNKIQSTEKNALVSVFLRVLEYYQGIMFLTTNQIANFDVAIPSRIHVAIQYESLKQSQMQAIFEEFLNRLDKKQVIDDYDEIKDWLESDVYRQAGKEGLDGRQIRNLVTTSLGLARAEHKDGGGRKLRVDHMKRAFNIMNDFKRDFSTQMQRYIDSQEKMIK